MSEEMICHDVWVGVVAAFGLLRHPELDGDEHVQDAYMLLVASKPVILPPI